MTRKSIVEKIIKGSCAGDGLDKLQVTRAIFFEAQEIEYKLDPAELNEMVNEILSRVHSTIMDKWALTSVGALRKKLEALPDHMPVFQEMTDNNWRNVEFLYEGDIYYPYIPVFYAGVSTTRKGEKAFVIGCSY